MVQSLSVRRRHRLNEDETPLVYGLVSERLRGLLEWRDNLEEAEALFRLFYRMVHYGPGRPAYPEPFTWSILEACLMGHYDWFVEPGDHEEVEQQ